MFLGEEMDEAQPSKTVCVKAFTPPLTVTRFVFCVCRLWTIENVLFLSQLIKLDVTQHHRSHRATCTFDGHEIQPERSFKAPPTIC